ncbi:MAG: spermine synthase [Anaerolineaceae bacterium]|nr:spermine synthase [Anaerolineaceae bacterium]
MASKTSQRYLYLTVFICGMSTLALELSASRLLGNVFGTSNLIWANVIGLMLLYLSVGYFIGGRWADRSPQFNTLFRIILWASFLSALIPLLARPVLRTAASAVFGAEAGVALGSFVSVLVLFSIPVTLLGCVSPFAIRLAVSNVSSTGKTAGQIYALSTIGSLVGTFLPVLVLIPQVGTFMTFIVFAALLYLVAFFGLWQQQPRSALVTLWMPVVIGLLIGLVLNGPLRAAAAGAEILYDDDSAYNYIQVQQDANGYRYLYLNEGQGIHSQWHPDIYSYQRTWSFFLTAPYFNNPPYRPDEVESLAIVGLAGGTIARQYSHIYGDIPIDGIEIDPDIIEVSKQFFGMDELPKLTTYAEDGRLVLNQLSKKYSLIAVDAYRPPYIPWHLTTVEFFQELKQHLPDDGVVAINVGRTDTDRRLVDALTATMLEVFPSVHAMDVPLSFNTILVATDQPTEASNLAANLALLPADASPVLRDALTLGIQHIVPAQASDLVFTDDHAPVETLVDSLVLNFLLAGGAEQLNSEN